jgi:ketosteroid isomerase-like protein
VTPDDAQVVERVYQAFLHGDVDTALSHFDPDVE